VVRARAPEAVHRVDVDARSLPARLGHLAGREGWWFAWRIAHSGLAPEERLVHLVLWHDGEGWRALDAADAAAFAALPARDGRGASGGTVPLEEAPDRELARLSAALLAEAEERSLAALDSARERWDRFTEDQLAGPRRVAAEARDAWDRARTALHEEGSALSLRERRALLERAEREHRRRLADLRTAEAARYAEKDRTLADLRRKAEVRPTRRRVATALWRCG
jgi:hypothetical protein